MWFVRLNNVQVMNNRATFYVQLVLSRDVSLTNNGTPLLDFKIPTNVSVASYAMVNL